MKKILLCKLMLVFFVLDGIGQCPSGLVEFNSQAQIDQFIIDYPNCTELSELAIDGVGISNLSPLSKITKLTSGNLIIQNTSLNTLEGLGSLTSLTNFSFINNDLISSFSPLNGVEINRDVIIKGNEILFDINAFILVSNTLLEITDNPSLYSCDASYVCELIDFEGIPPPGFQVYISNNASGCNSITEVKEDCNTICPSNYDAYNFTSQEQIDRFFVRYPDCTNIPFGLSVSGEDITNLNGLKNIEVIEGGLGIENNPLLVNLDGLAGLTFIGVGDYQDIFYINNNASLESLSGLSNANTGVGVELGIVGNPMLKNLEGLENFNPELFNLYIGNNSSLVDLSGLEVFKQVEDLYINDNINLTSLNGLNNLRTITSSIHFYNNDKVKNFLPFSSVSLSCGVWIYDNSELNSIEGFNFSSSDCYSLPIYIKDNPKLSVCSIDYICDIIDFNLNDVYETQYTVENNGLDCESIDTIIQLCNTQTPSNDGCENSSVIDLEVPFTANFDGSTASGIIPTCQITSPYLSKDVWYTFNSGNTTSISVSLPDQLKFQIWTGDCENLIPQENGCSRDSKTDIAILPDTDYLIQFWLDAVLSRKKAPDYEIVINSEETLNIEEYSNKKIMVMPNPTTGWLSIESTESLSNFSVEVFDLLGKTILMTADTEFDLKPFPSGIYILKINMGSGVSISKKIVKL